MLASSACPRAPSCVCLRPPARVPCTRAHTPGDGLGAPQIDTAKGLVEQILTYGRVVRPALGISLAPEQVLQQLGLEGVLIYEVPGGGPAYRAGLAPTYRTDAGDWVLGDIIVGLDGRKIRQARDLFEVRGGACAGVCECVRGAGGGSPGGGTSTATSAHPRLVASR